MSSNSAALAVTPLEVRIRLSHAYFQNLANHNKIDLLHIKGYAFGSDTYRPKRTSSDADLLVRPAHVTRFMWLLKQDGWKVLTTFESGSIFEHAATIYHPSWGLCDVHRYFPGIGFEDPSKAFNQLWEARRYKEIAHFPCATLSLLDARMMVVIHSARSLEKEKHPDISYLQQELAPEYWETMRERAIELDSLLAFDTALGKLDTHKDSPYYLLWKAISEDVPPYIEWWARIKRADGMQNKIRVAIQIFTVNEDHLAMDLGHTPSKAEKREKFFGRFKKLVKK